jgi:hypothetical protein
MESGAGQPVVADLQELPLLLAADDIHRLVEMLGYMEGIAYDLLGRPPARARGSNPGKDPTYPWRPL